MATHWQPTVGTVVKTAADEDPIGLLTVLSLGSHGHLRFVQEVRAYLASRCPTATVKQKLAQVRPSMHGRALPDVPSRLRGSVCCHTEELAGLSTSDAALLQAWDASGTGLLVSERLMNCPPQLAPPLQQALFDEVAWATEDEPTAELRASFRFKRYIALSRAYSDSAAAQQPQGTSMKQGRVGAQRKRCCCSPSSPLCHGSDSGGKMTRSLPWYLRGRKTSSTTGTAHGRSPSR